MADYKTMYRVLFAATEDVLALLEKYMASAEELAVPIRIQAILENAQQKCAPSVTNYLQTWSKKVKNSC